MKYRVSFYEAKAWIRSRHVSFQPITDWKVLTTTMQTSQCYKPFHSASIQWCSQCQNIKAKALTFESKAWTFESKAWTFESKAWTFEAKAWTFESKAWTFESKARTFESKAWTFESKAWTFEAKAWTFEYKAWTFESKARTYESKAIYSSICPEQKLRYAVHLPAWDDR